VTLKVYDVTGRLVATLVDQDLSPGCCNVAWRGRDHDGRRVASGMYFARLEWNGKHETRRPLLAGLPAVCGA
jgi:flagellar hook assembly protein FlgD